MGKCMNIENSVKVVASVSIEVWPQDGRCKHWAKFIRAGVESKGIRPRTAAKQMPGIVFLYRNPPLGYR